MVSPALSASRSSLNVVNADIRDILNYITEQYGVNFVIDSSVAAVPVTVNVQDVPWNVALDAVLKANRLGIEATAIFCASRRTKYSRKNLRRRRSSMTRDSMLRRW
jgi:hypothetical protein